MTGNFCIDQSCKHCSRNLHALRLTALGISTRKLLQMSRFRFQIFCIIAFGVLVPTAFSFETFPPASGPLVSGSKATLRYGVAAAPINAPLPVKRAIWAANQLRRKPYRYGGGHRSFFDDAYDCSGTVSYVLAAAGLVRSPISSDEFRSFGSGGEGKWITVYARNGHTFAVIAGLRLDTTEWNEIRANKHWAPRWRSNYRRTNGFEARHPVGL